jgi:hypothetical protein
MSDERDDNELEEELRELAARIDPVPPLLMQAAIDALSWRDIDAELAELVFDSLFDADEASLVRSSADRRMVTFRTPGLTIDVEVSSAGSGRSVMGQIVPPQRARVEIRHREGTTAIDADELGRFQSGTLQAGPVSLRLHPETAGGQPAVITDWVSI